MLSTGLQRDSGSGEARSHGAVGVAEQSLEVGSDIERATGRAAGRAAAAGHDLIRTGAGGRARLKESVQAEAGWTTGGLLLERQTKWILQPRGCNAGC